MLLNSIFSKILLHNESSAIGRQFWLTCLSFFCGQFQFAGCEILKNEQCAVIRERRTLGSKEFVEQSSFFPYSLRQICHHRGVVIPQGPYICSLLQKLSSSTIFVAKQIEVIGFGFLDSIMAILTKSVKPYFVVRSVPVLFVVFIKTISFCLICF